MKNRVTAIRIIKGDIVFHVHGDNEGAEGVWLAKEQVHGIYDAPVKTTYKTGAFQDGSRFRSRKWLHRDLELGFHIRETDNLYELNESLFRQVFEYQEDPWDDDPQPTTIEVETTLSGVRRLDVLMYEEPELDTPIDPLMQQHSLLIMKLRAQQPFWYEYNPDTGTDYADEFTATSTSAAGELTVSNPADQVMYHKFVLTRATWTLPDVQWVGAKGERAPGGTNGTRTVSNVEVSEVNGGATVDLDRQELMFRDANDTNILGQLAGKFFNYAIPPYTPETGLAVSYTGAPTGGAMVRLIMPRHWSRPWGLELPTMGVTHSPFSVRFVIPGDYTFEIPAWCDTIDVVAVGGGGGGQTDILPGLNGGGAGDFASATLQRGIDIPWETTAITGVVGAGGAGDNVLAFGDNATNGESTTAVATGMSTITAAGGTAGGSTSMLGEGPGPLTFNGRIYQGGADAQVLAVGRTPGGGGGSGWFLSVGGNGAPGAAWFYAYQQQPIAESGSESGSSS